MSLDEFYDSCSALTCMGLTTLVLMALNLKLREHSGS